MAFASAADGEAARIKTITVAAGVFEVNFWTLVSASLVGRSARFFLVGGVLYCFGPQMKAQLSALRCGQQ